MSSFGVLLCVVVVVGPITAFSHSAAFPLLSLQVFTILCGPSCNLGAVRSTAIPLLKEALEPLGTTLINSLKPDWHDDAGATTYYHQ